MFRFEWRRQLQVSVNNFPCSIDTCKHIEQKKVLLEIKIVYFTD